MSFKVGFRFIIICLLANISCKKDDNPKHFTGIYRGSFDRIKNGTDTTGTGVVFLMISTENGSFRLEGDSLSLTPTSSGGTYQIIDRETIKFTNTAPIGVPVFDRFYILDTAYRFLFDDPYLRFELTDDTLRYAYNLIRY